LRPLNKAWCNTVAIHVPLPRATKRRGLFTAKNLCEELASALTAHSASLDGSRRLAAAALSFGRCIYRTARGGWPQQRCHSADSRHGGGSSSRALERRQ